MELKPYQQQVINDLSFVFGASAGKQRHKRGISEFFASVGLPQERSTPSLVLCVGSQA